MSQPWFKAWFYKPGPWPRMWGWGARGVKVPQRSLKESEHSAWRRPLLRPTGSALLPPPAPPPPHTQASRLGSEKYSCWFAPQTHPRNTSVVAEPPVEDLYLPRQRKSPSVAELMEATKRNWHLALAQGEASASAYLAVSYSLRSSGPPPNSSAHDRSLPWVCPVWVRQ